MNVVGVQDGIIGPVELWGRREEEQEASKDGQATGMFVNATEATRIRTEEANDKISGGYDRRREMRLIDLFDFGTSVYRTKRAQRLIERR
jgi:hypothetical protein